MQILFSIILMVSGIVIPYLVFTKYLEYVQKNHRGFSDEESLEEATIFGFGFMCIAFFPVGLILLIHLI